MKRIYIILLGLLLETSMIGCYGDKGNYDYHWIQDVKLDSLLRDTTVSRSQVLKIEVDLKKLIHGSEYETEAANPEDYTYEWKAIKDQDQNSLKEDMVRFRKGASCCVVLASDGYPKKYETGFAITMPELGANEDIYVAGARLADGKLLTSGGRVLGAVATADTLKEAIAHAYAVADKIHFENAYMRRDIGQRALMALKGE